MDFSRLQNVIQSLCDKKGITARTAYTESGVGRSFYDNIRKGSVPSVEKLQALAMYFGVSLDYLVGNTDCPDTIRSNNDIPEINDNQLKFALFGTTDIDDDLLEDVKKLAKLQQQLKAQKKGE